MRRVDLGALLALSLAAPVHARPFLYVANQDANTVTVIDTATDTLVVTVTGMNVPRRWTHVA